MKAAVLRLEPGRGVEKEVLRAREHVHTFCAGLSADTRAGAALLSSELVRNALRHGHRVVHLAVSEGRVRVEVSDQSSLALPVDAAEHSTRRGLLTVGAVASTSGAKPGARSCDAVWFVLEAP
jgi:anti-sigma regulatory factor (Ser/Thr protein kinase)